MLDKDDFEALFTSHYHCLWLYARRFILNSDVAEDIVQEVFYNLWKIRHDFETKGSLKAYLFSATYNKCLNYIKHNKIVTKHKEEILNHNDRIEDYFYTAITEHEYSIPGEDLSSIIKEALYDLPDQCRRIFLLSRKYGFKNREVAEFLNISQKVVEKQISKALSYLRKKISKK
jgi:RNA polymerase sigma-70 factor (ECF subfamily)